MASTYICLFLSSLSSVKAESSFLQRKIVILHHNVLVLRSVNK